MALSRTLLFGSSVLLHAGLAVGVRSLPPPARGTDVAIVVTESRPAPKPIAEAPPPEPEAPPPPKAPPLKAAPKPATPAAKAAAAPAPAAPTPAAPAPGPVVPAGDGPGLPVGGAGGTGNGTGNGTGLGGSAGTPAPPVARAPAPPQDTCSEPTVKPKAANVVEPAYTEGARAAGLQGRVRVEITVGPDGRVVSARVIQGLGQGLDEAALTAARASTFTAATRCGRPISATFTIGMRFSL